MPKRVRVEGLGVIEFPDSWTDNVIALYARSLQQGGPTEPEARLTEGRISPMERYGGAFLRGLVEKSPTGRYGGMPPALTEYTRKLPPPQGGRLERTLEGVGALSDPLTLGSFALGGFGGGALAARAGLGAMGKLAGSAAGAMGSHAAVTQSLETPGEPGKVLKEAGKRAALGIPLGLAAPIANPVVRTIAEGLIFGGEETAITGIGERRIPTRKEVFDNMADGVAFMVTLRAAHGLPMRAMHGLAKPTEYRTAPEQRAVEQIPAAQMGKIRGEIEGVLRPPQIEGTFARPPEVIEAPGQISLPGHVRPAGPVSEGPTFPPSLPRPEPPVFPKRLPGPEEVLISKTAGKPGLEPPLSPRKRFRALYEGEEPTGREGFLDIGAIKDVGDAVKAIFDKPTPSYLDVVGKVDAWRIGRNRGAKDAQILERKIIEKTPDVAIRRAIPDAIETGLQSPEVLEAAKPYQKALNDLFDIALREGLIKDLNDFMENYVPHIVLDAPKGQAKGARGGSLEKRPFFTKQRVRKETGETYKIRELEELGYTLETDVSKLLPIYTYRLQRAVANKRLFNGLVENKVLVGERNIPEGKESEYRPIRDPQFEGWMAGEVGRPLYIKNDAYHAIRNIIGEYADQGRFRKVYRQLRTGVKRIIMFNPLVHGFNIEAQIAMYMGPQYVTKVWPQRVSDTIRHATRKPPRMTADEVDAFEQRMIDGGVELEGLYDLQRRFESDTYEIALGRKTAGQSFRDIFTNLVKEHPFESVRALRDFGDSLLWEHWVRPGQMLLFERQAKIFRKQGFTEAEADRMSGGMTNDSMGTIPPTWFTKNQRSWLRRLTFARNWNVSNARSAFGCLGVVHPKLTQLKGIPKPLRFEGYTDAQMSAVGKRYSVATAVGVAGLLSSSYAIQMMLTGKPIWDNEEGHRYDIDTGMIDAKGRKVYIKNWMFRQIGDYDKFIKAILPGNDETTRDFVNAKFEPLLRTLIEVAINYSIWERRPITNRNLPLAMQTKDTAGYVFRALTPYDTFAGQEREVRGKWEAILPLTGTWVRHGMPTGGNVVMADAMKDYLGWLQENRALDRIPKQKVDQLLQKANATDDPKKKQEYWDQILVYMEPAAVQELAFGGGISPEAWEQIQAGQKQMPLFGGRLSAESIQNLAKKRSDWVGYMTRTQSGALQKSFLEWLISEPEERQREIIGAMGIAIPQESIKEN